jgi:hypothetical protein
MPANPAAGPGGTPLIAGGDIVSEARKWLGVPYVFGGTNRQGVDCSGLVRVVYQPFGITTPRTTSDMVAQGSPLRQVDRSQIGLGDLVMSHWNDEHANSHVAIYAGNNTVIEAPQPGQNVRITKLDDSYWAHVNQVLRVPGVDPGNGTTASGNPPGILTTLGTLGAGAVNGVAGLLPFIPNPKNLTEAATNIGSAATSLANSAIGVGRLAELATKLFLPTNLLRGALFAAGVAFILIGILFLGKEVADA